MHRSCPRSCPSVSNINVKLVVRHETVILHSCMTAHGGVSEVRRDPERTSALDLEVPGSTDPAFERSNLELSQKRALAPIHHRRINSLRHNDTGRLTRLFTALYGNVHSMQEMGLPARSGRSRRHASADESR
jgi:hypothetical protein